MTTKFKESLYICLVNAVLVCQGMSLWLLVKGNIIPFLASTIAYAVLMMHGHMVKLKAEVFREVVFEKLLKAYKQRPDQSALVIDAEYVAALSDKILFKVGFRVIELTVDGKTEYNIIIDEAHAEDKKGNYKYLSEVESLEGTCATL